MSVRLGRKPFFDPLFHVRSADEDLPGTLQLYNSQLSVPSAHSSISKFSPHWGFASSLLGHYSKSYPRQQDTFPETHTTV